jgi:O-antigen/teichoic acid export membrane protein
MSFVCGIFITRALGPESRGIYFLILTFVSLVTMICTLGLPNANIVFVAQRRYGLGSLHANSVAAALGLTACILAGYGASSTWLSASILAGVPVTYVIWGLAQAPLLLYENFASGVAIGVGEVGRYNWLQLARSAVSTVLVVGLFVLNSLDLPALLATWTLTNILAAATLARILRRHADSPLRLSWHAFRDALGFGVKVHFGGIATMIWQRFDSFFLNATHGTAAVGQYSLAVSITEGLWKIVGPVVNAIQRPVVSAGSAEGLVLTQRVLRHVLFVLSILGGTLGLTAHWVIPVLYGAAFAPAVPAARLLLLGTIGVGLAMVMSVYFVGVLDRGGMLSTLAWLNAIVNVVGCVILIPSMGVWGAALASAITYVLGTVVVLVLFRGMTKSRWVDLLILRRRDLADYGALIRSVTGGFRG